MTKTYKKGYFTGVYYVFTSEWDVVTDECEQGLKFGFGIYERSTLTIGKKVIGPILTGAVTSSIPDPERFDVGIGKFKMPQPNKATYRIIFMDAPGFVAPDNNEAVELNTPQQDLFLTLEGATGKDYKEKTLPGSIIQNKWTIQLNNARSLVDYFINGKSGQVFI